MRRGRVQTYTDVGVGEARLGKRFRESKVAELHHVVLIQEHCSAVSTAHEIDSRRTIVGLKISVEDLCPLGLPVICGSCTPRPAVAIRMMTMIEREEDLHKVVPDGVFGDGSVVSLGLFDDGGEVAASAVLHENVKDASIAVNVSVVISYDVFVVQVLEDVAARGCEWPRGNRRRQRRLTLLQRFASYLAQSSVQNSTPSAQIPTQTFNIGSIIA